MKNLILVLGLFLIAVSASAQTRFLIGPTGGYVFNNTYFGVTGSIEIPFLKNHRYIRRDQGVAFEDTRNLISTCITGEFDPLEIHTGLGRGYSYQSTGSAILWARNHFGLTGDFKYGGYEVAKARKHSYVGESGIVFRGPVAGSPLRFYLLYFRQLHDGISSNGTETNHVQGGRIAFDVRAGCFSHGCVRVQSTVFEVAHVLNQGNPVCDGTYTPSHITCPRDGGYTGGSNVTVLFEFPRRQPGHETDLF